MISKELRFHGYGSLRYLYKNGDAIRLRPFTVKYVKNKFRKNPRIAVVVSKKVLKSAVSRNRVRRRIFEHIRPLIGDLGQSYDIAIIVTSTDVLEMESKDITKYLRQAIYEIKE